MSLDRLLREAARALRADRGLVDVFVEGLDLATMREVYRSVVEHTGPRECWRCAVVPGCVLVLNHAGPHAKPADLPPGSET